MRLPLRARVVMLVTAFNAAFFAGGLVWSVERLRRERAELVRVEETFVREGVRNLLLDVRGDQVTRLVLAWPNWRRFQDALLVQLKEFEERFGLLPQVRAVAESGAPQAIPRGYALPLRRPPARTPASVPWPGLFPFSLLRGIERARLPWPHATRPGEVWGAVFVRSVPFLLGRWPATLARARFLGLPPGRQAREDALSGGYLRSVMSEVRELGAARLVEGGLVLPLYARDGQRFGAAYAPWLPWARLPLDPASWLRALVFVGRSELGFAPTLDVSGLYLNPLGSARRPATFDEEAVLSDIRRAVVQERTLEAHGRGLAVPLRLASGEMWGGVWLAPRAQEIVRPLLIELLPAFLLSTLLLTGATFFGMHTLVLEPVRHLARGARRLARGDLSVRIPETRRRDELSELVRSFNTMAGQVEGFNARLALEVEQATRAAREAEAAAMTQRRLAAMGELAAGIAHEINNPLGGLLNAVEVLRREDLLPEKRARYFELVGGGLERIRETVGRLLRLSPRSAQAVLVDLVDPLGDALGLVRHRATQQGTRLCLEGVGGEREFDAQDTLEAWRGLPPLFGRANELGQAVLNLLVNALDATEGRTGRTVRLGLAAEGGELHLWVRDDGPGMDEESLPRAADLFFTTKEIGRGTGLGMAIVHHVVTGHGGRVRWSNQPEGGFRVDLHLPAARA